MTTHYIWDVVNDSYLMETDGAGSPTAVYTNEPVPYGRLVSQRRNSTTSYYHFDGQGSTRQLTDQDQNVTDVYMYSTFGEAVATSGTTTNPFRYIGALGYYVDPETADMYIRARSYSAARARWLSRDPIGFVGDLQLYSYVGNNPVSFADASGLERTMQQTILCTALEEKIKGYLTSPEERRFFDHFSDPPFLGFPQTDVELTESEVGAIMLGILPSQDDMRRNCLQGKDGDAKSDVAQAKAPWGAVLGTFSYKWSYRCTTCGVESQACLSHHYDFDFKGFLATHRALDAEFKVLLIAYSQGLLGCDWRPYGIKGCTYKAIEC